MVRQPSHRDKSSMSAIRERLGENIMGNSRTRIICMIEKIRKPFSSVTFQLKQSLVAAGAKTIKQLLIPVRNYDQI